MEQGPPPGYGAELELTLVIPTHNSELVIEKSLAAAAARLVEVPCEIVLVENGSTDDTRQILDRVVADWPASGPSLVVLTVPKGLGNALRAGMIASRGRTVMITGDDLPFGFDELDQAERLGLATHPVVIGSKAHPDSEIGRSVVRTLLTAGHRVLRRVTLGMRVADPQGTYVLHGSWARAVAPALRESGFLYTTELAYAATLAGLEPVEVPVRLRESAQRTRVRLADIWRMGVGLIGIRRRRAALTAALRDSTTPD